jgi:hypothetical protein
LWGFGGHILLCSRGTAGAAVRKRSAVYGANRACAEGVIDRARQ